MKLRLVRRAVWLAFALTGPLAAAPASSLDHGVCDTIDDPAARSGCIAVGRAARARRPRPGPPSVRSVVEPVTARPAEAVVARAIARAPDQYVGRPLAIRDGDCRYVDVNRYVCTTADAPPIEIHANVIMPPTAQVAVEAGRACGGGSAPQHSPACSNLMLFTPNAARAGGGPVVLTTSALWLRLPDRAGSYPQLRRTGPKRVSGTQSSRGQHSIGPFDPTHLIVDPD